MLLLVDTWGFGAGFLGLSLQLLELNIDDAVTCLLGLHELEAIEVCEEGALLSVDNLFAPGGSLPFLSDLSLGPCLHD